MKKATLYRVGQKTGATLHFPEYLKTTKDKTVPKMPTSPEVCACTTLGNSKYQIEPSMQ